MGKRISTQQITSWSFSRYSTYKQCPLKAKLQFINKIKEPPNQAMERGAKIHDLAEAYIKGFEKRLPPELNQFSKQFKALRTQYKKSINGMTVEDTWAFTKNWDETTWNDWIHCWVRIKLDCAYHADDTVLIVADWKTGKFRQEMNEDYVEQLELYALAALLLHAHIEEVRPCLVYLDHGIIYPEDDDPLIFTREDIPRLKKLWEKRTKPMLSDKVFAPRPNDKCCWCFFRKNNKAAGGGQCKY